MSRLFAGLALVIASPVIAILSLVIVLTSRGPAIFAQTRIGRDQQPFVCYKLRTMQTAAPQAATHQVDAAMVTPFGRFLRTTKLDELPQLYNVARGDMAFIGPRPCLPSQTELIEARARLGVYEMLPGITGIAQIRGIDMSAPERLAIVDAEYLMCADWWTDAKILVATVVGAGFGDRVMRAVKDPAK